MKFSYGLCDFYKIITQGYVYCDRTGHIPLLESNEYQLFIRPRRFGKSLLLSMLFNYYDVARADEFEQLFGHLAIGKNPTPLRNHFFMLRWDFSCVDPFGDAADIRKALHDHVNARIRDFQAYYEDFLKKEIDIDWDNAVNTIQSVLTAARASGYPIYLLIDEYDNFANQVMMGVGTDNQKRYEALVFEEGPLRTLFKAVKASTSESLFDRIFITGVSPLVMSDITSGHNISKSIYLNPRYSSLCGFTPEEVARAIDGAVEACHLPPDRRDEARERAMVMMRTWYDGYRFAPGISERVYNPTLILYFCDALAQLGTWPDDLLDDNLAMDRAKLSWIATLAQGEQLLLDIVQKDAPVVVRTLAKRFGIQEMLSDHSQDQAFKVSLLYYLGVLALDDRLPDGRQALKVPNLVTRRLYVERLADLLLPQPAQRDTGREAADLLCRSGDLAPLATFVEQHYFKVFHNRDYRWANELTVKTAFLTLLYNDTLYIMDSEPALERSHADLTLIIRPDMRRFTILDLLIEFKYVPLQDAKVSGRQARELTPEALQNLPPMKEAMREAVEQVQGYGKVLMARHGNLRLRCYAVVALGFERLWWQEV